MKNKITALAAATAIAFAGLTITAAPAYADGWGIRDTICRWMPVWC